MRPVMPRETISIDLLIFGGGVAGLWLLDEAVRAGHDALLLEKTALGAGQTIWSQGIIHGGVKYALDGIMNPSAQAIRDMPALWRACLAGELEPRLAGVRVRSHHCYLWQTASLASRMGMMGARIGLRVAPIVLNRDERPSVLRDCPGVVARLDEQVIDPASLLAELAARQADRIALYDADAAEFVPSGSGSGRGIRLRHPESGTSLELMATTVVLAAGGGNPSLAERFGLPHASGEMQIRPLHMALVRGKPDRLPELYGHCVDGGRTRVTITSAMDRFSRRVWQVGGEIAERGVKMSSEALRAFCAAELEAVLPGLDISKLEFGAYVAPRAERATRDGKRPEGCSFIASHGVIRAWPTKLALAPRLATDILASLPSPSGRASGVVEAMSSWPRPAVAEPPWETESNWADVRSSPR